MHIYHVASGTPVATILRRGRTPKGTPRPRRPGRTALAPLLKDHWHDYEAARAERRYRARADAIKVAITESVTIAAPGQEADNSEPESTGALPSDASAGELNNAPELATPTQNGTD
jgi:hypothetical protein